MEGEEERSEESDLFQKQVYQKNSNSSSSRSNSQYNIWNNSVFILMSCIGMYVGTEDTIINHIKFAGEETGQLFISLLIV